jgi:ribosome-binding factor A
MTTEKTSTRLDRINTAIAHEVGELLRTKIEDKRLKHAQINHAVVSKDLSYAKIYFTVDDASHDVKVLARLLNNAAKLFRHHLARTLDLRVTPEVKFYYDEQSAKTSHLLDLISKL